MRGGNDRRKAMRMSWFYELNPVLQALMATVGTWLLTALGASLVFFTKSLSQKYLDTSLGMAAGVMARSLRRTGRIHKDRPAATKVEVEARFAAGL